MKKAKDKKGNPQAIPSRQPTTIVGRQREFEMILDALISPKSDYTSLYLCGKPGTGKSFITSQVLSEVRYRKVYLQRFTKIIELNGMELRRPSELWEKVSSHLSLPKKTPVKDHLLSYLERLKKPVLLVIDEFENLISSQKRLGSEILSLPAHIRNLALICISNRVDLPRHMISDLDAQPTIIVFPPYSKSDILGIIQAEFPDYELTYLEICARQVDKTGDIRKAIEMCSKAMKNGTVTLASTLKAATSWTSWENTLKSLPNMQKAALLACKGMSGECNAGQMHAFYKAKCRKVGAEPIEANEFVGMLNNLAALGVVTLEGRAGDDRKKIVQVNVEAEELLKTCDDVPELKDFYSKNVQSSWKFKA